MDPITGALLAGAAAAPANETAKAVVKDAYEGLKAKVKQWFAERKRPEGETALTMIEEEPEAWQSALAASLKKSGAVDNEELLQAAQAFIQVLQKSSAGRESLIKYQVQIGVQGDNAKVEGGIHFGGQS